MIQEYILFKKMDKIGWGVEVTVNVGVAKNIIITVLYFLIVVLETKYISNTMPS